MDDAVGGVTAAGEKWCSKTAAELADEFLFQNLF